MESQSTVSPTPMSGTQIVTRGPTEDEEAPFAMNSSSPFLNDAFSPSASTVPDSSEGDPANATDAAPTGRKRRLSFKEKQRQSISHFASSSNATTASKSTLPSEASPTGAAAAAAIQSPVSTLSSLSPQQSDLSPSEAQVLQPARKKTSTDVTSNSPAVGCVFTALEPTRGVGLRRSGGAAKPPNRGMHAHASPTQSGSALSLSPVTSAEPSPLNRASSPPERVSASTSLPQSPLLRRPAGSSDLATTTTTATVPANSHSSASPPTVTRPTVHGIITTAAAAAAEPPRMSESGPPEHSLDNIVSEASASSPKASSSSSVASPKMSFKDRQRAAAAAASGAAASPCRTLSSRGSVSSPVNRTGPAAGASNSFNTRSPSYSFSAAETSVNLERPTSASSPLRTLALPATAAILSPKLQPSLHVDPTTTLSTAAASPSSPQQARGSSSSGRGVASGQPKPETSPLQSIPRLPIERIRSSGSGHTPLQSYTTAPQPSSASASCVKAQTTPPQHQQQQQLTEALPALPPLTLSPTPARANAPAAVENSGAPSSPATRSTRSAPATATERRNNPLHTSGSNTTGQTSTSSTGHPTTAELHSRSSQTGTSSRGEDDDDDGTMDDDEENPALAFTQNTTQLHVYDGEEPSPQVFAMATPQHSNAGGGGVGSSEESVRTRSGTVVERGVDEGTAVAHRGRSSNERHPFPTRRARTDSLDSPPLHTGTVPSSPLPGNPVSGSTGSHSQRYVSHTEQDRPPGKVDRPGNIMVGHWKQHGGKSSHQHHQQQQQQQQMPTTATHLSSSQELQPHQTDSGEHSFTFGESQLSRTSRSRARRHRDKMLAPDGAVLSTPRTGRGPGGNEGGGNTSVFANANLPPRMHGRSYTVDDFALYSASGNRRGTLTPSTVTPSSVMFTAHPTPMTVVPPVSGHAGGNPTPAARAHAGPLESSGRLAGPPLPLSPSTHDTMPSEDFVASSDRRSRQTSSPRNRGIVTFPSLPPLHDNTNPPAAGPTGSSGHHTSALSRLSFAMAAVLTPSAPSAENISAATPVTVATPNGYRSGDERSSNEASRGNPADRFMDIQLAEMRGQTTVAEDDGDVGDSDYLLQTYNTYYGGEASLSATTAELRKSRRRSNYSSLHYGTMTGYRHRGDSRRPRSSSAAKQQKSDRQRRQSPRRGGAATARTTAEDEEESKEKDKQKRSTRGGAEPLLVRSVTAVAEARHSSTDPDDEESICEQKGSEEEEEKEKARVRAAPDHTHRKQQEQQHHQEQRQRRRDGDGGALVDEGEDEDDVDGRQRRTVGIWETIENIFLPRYELVPEAVSKEPLTVPASPNSPHPSGNGSSGKPELKTELSSPIMANLKSSSSSPKALSSSGPQPHQQQQPHPPPAVLLASPPAPVKSPDSTATTPPALLPPSLSAQNSPSIGPAGGSRPSGLVVLPDAANLGDDPSSSASLTFSQFRKTPAQMAGTKRLEPEKFTFGTVAANYNMEPADEQRLPEGAADAKVAARLVFEAASGVMLMDPEDEGGRYAQQGGHTSPDALNRSTSSAPRSSEEGGSGCGGEEGEGACQCSASFIAKDFKGLDCSRYDASELYDHCSRCHRRPAAFLCLHCHEAVCPSHVRRHHLLNPTQCTLFLNLLDIMSSFDRIFWCEKCQQFTWKHTEVYDALVDQIAYTRGTYLKHPARDIHCVGYEVRLKDATAAGVAAASATAAAAAALIRPKSEHSISDDATSSTCGSPARLRRAVSGSSVNPALQNLNPQPGLATFPTISGASLPARSPQMRGGTPPVHSASPHRGGHSYLAPPPPSMLGVNNLIVFGASPSSPMGGNGAASRLHTNAIGTPSLHPLTSPMQHMLSRDPLEASGGRTVAVGEPVTKLCALGASVQGWRTTQEDAEAVFLVDIPALSNEVVDRKELRAMAAAAAANKKKRQDEEEQQQQQQQRAQDGGSHATGSTSSSLQHTLQPTGDDTTEDGKVNEEEGVGGEEQRGASPSSSCGPAVPLRLGSAVASARDASSGRMERDRNRSRASPLEEGDEEDNAADGSGEQKATETIPMAVFCVFDGHGGDAVAKLAARHFETHLRRAIDGTRADDVRARALLFYLNAESNAAAIAGPQPAVTAIPAADGSFTFLPPHSFAAAVAAVQQQQQQRGSIMTGSSSPPPLLPSSHNPTTSPQSGHTARTSSSQSRLLVPGNSQARPFDSCEAVPAVSSASPPMDNEEGDNDMPQILQLPDAVYAESIPVVMPVTAESLRLHMASSTANIPGSGHNAAGSGGDAASGGARAHPPSNLGQDSTGLQRNRRSKTTLDAWADMENPAAEMATSSGAAVAAAAASPLTAKLFSTSFTGAASIGGAAAHYGASSPQAAMAASTAYYPSPSAVVSIPEMEMLRQYFASIMEDALLSLDAYLRNTPEGQRGDYDCVGCTACVVGITANFVLCANVGDSGAAFYTKDRIKVISVKHRVSDAAEQQRINAAGYSIVNDRIEGMSAVPRALGDFDFKQCGGRGPHEQAVSAVPDVTIMPTPSDTDQWGIILACDGVWDTATLHQVHVALTNTVNDLDVASSATEAVLRGAELYQHHLRGPGAPCGDSPSSSPHRSATSVDGGGSSSGTAEAAAKHSRSREGSTAPSPSKRRALIREERGEGSVIGDDDGEEARRLIQVDPLLLTAAAGVFAQCVAPADNDEGVGLDNCSLIIVERRNVQE